MFGIKRLFGRKTEDDNRPSSVSTPNELARERFAQAEAEFFRGVEADIRRFSQQAPAQLIESDAADRRIAAMTIAFDPDGNRSTDTTSGMAVEYVRDDYPLELGEFWKLLWKGDAYDFRVSWSDGFGQIREEHPDLSIEARSRLTTALNLKEYSVPMVDTANPHDFLENIDVFVNLFAAVARNRLKSANIYVRFEPWGVDRQHHRRLKFAPLKAAE
jgi:hypothetical protein